MFQQIIGLILNVLAFLTAKIISTEILMGTEIFYKYKLKKIILKLKYFSFIFFFDILILFFGNFTSFWIFFAIVSIIFSLCLLFVLLFVI